MLIGSSMSRGEVCLSSDEAYGEKSWSDPLKTVECKRMPVWRFYFVMWCKKREGGCRCGTSLRLVGYALRFKKAEELQFKKLVLAITEGDSISLGRILRRTVLYFCCDK